MVNEQHIVRVLAWLLCHEGLNPRSLERAINSACDMRLGDSASLDYKNDDYGPYRRAFINEQLKLLIDNV